MPAALLFLSTSRVSAAQMAGTIDRNPNVRAATPASPLTSGSPLSLIVTNQDSSHKTAALSYWQLLLPISQGRRAHWPKPTELLNFDVVGSGGLQCGIQRLSLY